MQLVYLAGCWENYHFKQRPVVSAECPDIGTVDNRAVRADKFKHFAKPTQVR